MPVDYSVLSGEDLVSSVEVTPPSVLSSVVGVRQLSEPLSLGSIL